MLRSVLRCVACVHTAHTRTTDVLPPQLFPASSAARLIVSRPLNVRVCALPSYPLDTIKTRLHLGRALSVPSLPDMYRGLGSSLVGQVPYGMLTFGTYEIYKTALLRRFPVRHEAQTRRRQQCRVGPLILPGKCRRFFRAVHVVVFVLMHPKCVTRFPEEDVQNSLPADATGGRPTPANVGRVDKTEILFLQAGYTNNVRAPRGILVNALPGPGDACRTLQKYLAFLNIKYRSFAAFVQQQ